MLKVEYIKDDELSTIPLTKCNLCDYQSVCKTKCCDVKLCGWHIRDNGEHADKNYYSCPECETHTNVGTDGYLINYNYVYCDDHNNMIFCDKCDHYYCNEHTNNHEHIKWSIINPRNPINYVNYATYIEEKNNDSFKQ